MEIVQERLEREFNLSLLATAPSVVYKVTKTDSTVEDIDNPANWPSPTLIQQAEEPYVDAMIIVPTEYVGTVMEMGRERRGIYGEATPEESRALREEGIEVAQIPWLPPHDG